MKCWAIFLSAALTCGCYGCKNDPPAAPSAELLPVPTEAAPKMQTLKLWLGAAELITELALTPQQRQTGMMFRTQMRENEGMLFVFPVPHRASFWMLNTTVPLSAAYIDPEGIIREIHDLQPRATNAVVAACDQIQYVLETPQGWFTRHNISTGTVVRTESGSLRDTFFRVR